MDGNAPASGSRMLADPTRSKANCGVGVVMDLSGDRGHDVISDGLELLGNLEHRGTTGAETNTGDGAGILIQTPHEFLADELTIDLPDVYAVGSVFLPQDDDARSDLRNRVERTLAERGVETLTWRSVPTDASGLGKTAVDSEPDVWQVVVGPGDLSVDAFDRALYVARRSVENEVEDERPPGADRFYICSLDRQTVVYKGLLKGTQVPDYYPELTDERLQSNFAMVHARFSTNTLGAWHLAHPYRRIIHNGEFNTIRGNINWMRARETDLEHPAYGSDLEDLKPIINDPDQSDTASVDNALELLMNTGRSLPHALRMLIPEAWRGDETMPRERQDWYDYHASLVEPWDGPALVVATDGDRIGAVLDRNGLRPCRYEVSSDDRLVMASEAGALDTDPELLETRGRLQPGQLFLADPENGGVIPDAEAFELLTDDRYGEWVDAEQVRLDDLHPDASALPRNRVNNLRHHQTAYGYTYDELENLIEPMATEGKDPVGSMGDDTPLSVLSDFNRPLFSYFKQLFAQVSNPPVDNIREELVFSLETRLGEQNNLLDESREHARQLVLESPILRDSELTAVRELDENDLSTAVIDITFDPDAGLESAVETVREEAVSAIRGGNDVLILSDRHTGPECVAIPSLLAIGAVHHHLVRNGLRNHAGVVIESADPRTVHHICTLVGYGADAINPYLAYQTIEDIVAGPEGADAEVAIEAYVGALEDGLLKVMSKMGISTVESYQGAQIFEAVGLDSDFIAEYFEGTANRTEGIGIPEIQEDLLQRHRKAFDEVDEDLDRVGEFEFRSNGIFHQWNPRTVNTLQQAVRQDDYEKYQEFASMINDQQQNLQTLRGLLEFATDDRESVPIEEVEPVEDIVQRFATGSMSLGSLSPEAHETLSVAMNRLGAKSGSGEGGEPPERFETEKECNIKQVASGRFGVTSNYLSHADELQIKMAQGSKPGEGGHLPGHKVVDHIAHTRRTVPGVDLISPPPQHDIYSIEDLKQLIHDLKAGNPDADINVKLVAEDGVGIIAAGVAKANADVVHISGHSGGTGASPRTSIKNAGLPWELGLAETNQMLHSTRLRSRITVTVDGGFKTGRDVAVAALLGAEQYIFGTAALVTEGCVMARQCHKNTCPVGVATQNPDLRARFPGEPDHVINYMEFMAQEFREIMADLGFRSVDEMVGRVDLLRQRDTDHPKARKLDLTSILVDPRGSDERIKTREQTHEIDEQLDHNLIEAATPALESTESVELTSEITVRDRAVGATLSNVVSNRYGEDGLPNGTLTVDFEGAAGQSFGAFLQSGIQFSLEGVANDYVGKGLSGGTLVLSNPGDAPLDPTENTLIGNVAFYGATEGEAYINGVAGERFCVRNSGVRAVVEGVGDHGCEYMTGGLAVILGETGKNFAAGMSGGVAYVLDPGDDFDQRCNTEMVRVQHDLDDQDFRAIRRLVENHAAYTDSDRATRVLEEWDAVRDQFAKVMPDAYREAIKEYPDADARDTLPDAAESVDAPVPESAD